MLVLLRKPASHLMLQQKARHSLKKKSSFCTLMRARILLIWTEIIQVSNLGREF